MERHTCLMIFIFIIYGDFSLYAVVTSLYVVTYSLYLVPSPLCGACCIIDGAFLFICGINCILRGNTFIIHGAFLTMCGG